MHGWACNVEGLSVVAGHQGWSHCMTTHAQISTKHGKPPLIAVVKRHYSLNMTICNFGDEAKK